MEFFEPGRPKVMKKSAPRGVPAPKAVTAPNPTLVPRAATNSVAGSDRANE